MEAGVRAWLEPLRGSMGAGDAIAAGNVEHAIEGLNEGLWVRNGPRHSFGTYRVAVTRNVAQVALELGNSPEEVKKDYDDVRLPGEGREWFSLAPGVVHLEKLRGMARRAG